MSTESRRPLRAADVLVASISLVLLLMLMAPSLAQSAADARRNGCLNNMKQICLALHNHEATRLYFPAASTAPITAKPGNADESEDRAGYSWLAQVLPYMELAPLYSAMRDNSEKMTLSPFADSVRMGDGAGRLVANEPVEAFVCPGFEGKPAVDVEESDYKSDAQAGGAPAITNYFATSSTHLIERDGGWFLDSRAEAAIQGNGALPLFGPMALKGWQKMRGVTFAAISRDGTSNTLMFCEGREQAYAAWIDGQVAWTVGAWPTNPDVPKPMKDPAYPNAPDVLGWDADAAAENGVCIAKQPYGAAAAQSGVYLPADRWSGSKDRKFGPSGNHPGVAGHAFADGRASFIDEKIDRNVYLHLVTRAGMEVIPESAAQFIQR